MIQNREFLNFLIERGAVDGIKADIFAKKIADGSISNLPEHILSAGTIEEEKLTELLASYFSLPYKDLREQKIDSHALNTLSSDVSQNYGIVCFDNSAGKLSIAIMDPENFKAIEAVDFLAKGQGLKVEYCLVSKSSFEAGFRQYKSLSKEIDTALKDRAAEDQVKNKNSAKKDEVTADINDVTKSAPVVKIVSVIIRHAIEGGASDIHIEPIDKESRVRYRIDGILHTSLVLPRSVHDSIVSRIKVMANMKLDETRIPQDGRIMMDVSGQKIDFRVSVLPLVGTEKVVMRILYTNKGVPKLSDLGYIGEQLRIINSCAEQTEGIILVTGPTGSGKSTTLFALIGLLNNDGVNISTLEDPVEYQMPGISQSQIKPEIGYTFATGLRSFLRQDPDVIMVGEIRDEETAELSIHAALTGHLVLSTIHTTSAIGAIARLVDMKVEMFLLGSTLNTIIAQRLVRKVCPKCIEHKDPTDEQKKALHEELVSIEKSYFSTFLPDFSWDSFKLSYGKGCPACANTGYTGRLCISEVIDVNQNIKRLILDNKLITREDVQKNQIYTSMKQDGFIKVLMGQTSIEEVLRVMRD